jgi:peptidoglycan-N-acetylmuramic acid deacetylase
VKNLRRKSILATLIIATLCTSIPLYRAEAEHVKCFSWYTVPTKNEERPKSFEASDIIDKYDTIYLGAPDKKKIYLTFDAGYENGNVKKVVHTLNEKNVKGAFFVLPHFITANKVLVEQMVEGGHIICNHSTSHRDMSRVSDFESFKKELTDIEEIYRNTTGKELAKFYRPPEGKFSESNLEHATKLGYTTVLWSLAHADWDNNNQPSQKDAMEKILSRVHNGAVILLHPTSKTNADILDELITELENRGYSFGSLKEL